MKRQACSVVYCQKVEGPGTVYSVHLSEINVQPKVISLLESCVLDHWIMPLCKESSNLIYRIYFHYKGGTGVSESRVGSQFAHMAGSNWLLSNSCFCVSSSECLWPLKHFWFVAASGKWQVKICAKSVEGRWAQERSSPISYHIITFNTCDFTWGGFLASNHYRHPIDTGRSLYVTWHSLWNSF